MTLIMSIGLPLGLPASVTRHEVRAQQCTLMPVTCTSFQPFYIIETYQLREIQPFILFILMRNHSQTEEPPGASVTRHTHWDM